MVESSCKVGDGPITKLVNLEDAVVDVGDAIDVVFKNINAERVAEPWGRRGVEAVLETGCAALLMDT